MPTYSLVVPAYNEEAVVSELVARLGQLMDALDGDAEAILVDDGSRDRTYELMVEATAGDDRFRLVRLSRNFGHQIALTAGVDLAAGEAVVVMDADLQHPPEVVLELAKRWREGYDVVYGVRDERTGETRFKRYTADWFYRGFNRISEVPVPVDVGDFRLVDRRVLHVFLQMRESNRFVRGMFSWIGLEQIGVPYQGSERFAGESKYPLQRMLRFAVAGVISFSSAPLRAALKLGFAVSILDVRVRPVEHHREALRPLRSARLDVDRRRRDVHRRRPAHRARRDRGVHRVDPRRGQAPAAVRHRRPRELPRRPPLPPRAVVVRPRGR